MPPLSLELGKLMAQVETLQKQLSEIKNEVCALKKQITDVHAELLNFMGTVQPKSACQALHDKLHQNFIQRVEMAPFKSVLSVIALTTVTAICFAVLNLIFK